MRANLVLFCDLPAGFEASDKDHFSLSAAIHRNESDLINRTPALFGDREIVYIIGASSAWVSGEAEADCVVSLVVGLVGIGSIPCDFGSGASLTHSHKPRSV